MERDITDARGINFFTDLCLSSGFQVWTMDDFHAGADDTEGIDDPNLIIVLVYGDDRDGLLTFLRTHHDPGFSEDDIESMEEDDD